MSRETHPPGQINPNLRGLKPFEERKQTQTDMRQNGSFLSFLIIFSLSLGLMVWCTLRFSDPFSPVITTPQIPVQSPRDSPLGVERPSPSTTEFGVEIAANLHSSLSETGIGGYLDRAIPPEKGMQSIPEKESNQATSDRLRQTGPAAQEQTPSWSNDFQKPGSSGSWDRPSPSQNNFRPPTLWEASQDEWFGLRLRQINPWLPAVAGEAADLRLGGPTVNPNGPNTREDAAHSSVPGPIPGGITPDRRQIPEDSSRSRIPPTVVGQGVGDVSTPADSTEPNMSNPASRGARLRFPLQTRPPLRAEADTSGHITP